MRASLSDTEQTVLLDAVTAFMDVVRDAKIITARKKNIGLLQQRLKTTEIQFDLQRRTAADLAQAKARLAEGNADLTLANSNHQTSIANFKKIIGTAPPDKLAPPEFKIALPKLRKNAVLAATNDHPKILQAELDVKIAEDDVKLKEGARLPTLSFANSYGTSLDKTRGRPPETDTTTFTSSLTLSMPLFQSGSEISEVRVAKKTVYQRRDELREKVRNVRQEAVSAWENLLSNKKRIKSLRIQSDAAEVAQNNIAQELEVGRRTVQDLLDADKAVLMAKLNFVRANRDFTVSAYRLLSAIGTLNPKTLDLPIYKHHDLEKNLREIEYNLIDTNVK